jgi:hypothetical protein
VCIDQAKITESLRALPIFLVSCKRMLVVAGPTYVHRLWCIWELHMLFVSAGGGTPPVDVVGIKSNKTKTGASAAPVLVRSGEVVSELYRDLRMFELDMAHCFDPNEDRRLRAAISAAPGGAAAFEASIRELSRHGDGRGRGTSAASVSASSGAGAAAAVVTNPMLVAAQ